MLWFRRKKYVCDWCGSRFAHEPLQQGELEFCSEACLSEKMAPPRRAKAGRPKPTLEGLRADLDVLKPTVDAFAKQAKKAYSVVRGQHAEAYERLDQLSAEVWRELSQIVADLATLGRPTPTFDDLRKRAANQLASPATADLVTEAFEMVSSIAHNDQEGIEEVLALAQEFYAMDADILNLANKFGVEVDDTESVDAVLSRMQEQTPEIAHRLATEAAALEILSRIDDQGPVH